jgi:hypothetical protein
MPFDFGHAIGIKLAVNVSVQRKVGLFASHDHAFSAMVRVRPIIARVGIPASQDES